MKKRDNRVFATAINIVGMGVAFAVFMTLMVRVHWDWTYDRNFPEHEKVFRFEHNLIGDGGEYWAECCRPLIEQIKGSSPNVLNVGTCSMSYSILSSTQDNPDNKVSLYSVKADINLFDIFGIKLTEGCLDGFDEKDCIVISEKAAKTIFGNVSPVGKTLLVNNLAREVIGVFKDLPENCSIPYEAISSIGEENLARDSEWSYIPYIKLDNPELVDDTFRLACEKISVIFGGEKALEELTNGSRMVRLHDAHYEKDLRANSRTGDRTMTLSLLSLALLIIIIAVINFVNFSFARIPFRIKSINTRKVLGASRGSLILQEILSAAITATVAFLLALLLFHLVSGSPFAGYVLGSMKIMDNIWLILGSYAVTILIACLAGLIPAVYATSQPAAIVLKGSYSSSVRGRGLRNILIGMQFVLSFMFIILSLFMDVQIKHMIKKDMGFESENILQVNCGYGTSGHSHDALEEKLKQNAAIKDVTFGDGPLLSNTRMTWGYYYDDVRALTDVYPVAPDFASFFGIEIIEGRDFTESDNLSPTGTVIINEATRRKYPKLDVGAPFRGAVDGTTIVGICKDFNFRTAALPVTPMILYNWGSDGWRTYSTAFIKLITDDPEGVIDYIKKTVCEFDSTFSESTVEVSFMDDNIENLYKETTNIKRLMTTASLVALLIAIIGIIGLVYFDTQFLSKEIAVRRVNGASVGSILSMINKKYVLLCGCSFIIACPLAYMIIRFWRSNFSYQAAVPVWIFVFALVAVSAITVVMVTLQSWSAANSNPVESIKNE